MRLALIVIAAVLIIPGGVSAPDDHLMFSLSDALGTQDAKARLNQGVSFHFGSQSHGKVVQNYGEFTSNKKTNAFNKSDKQACEWAFLSAMLTFQQRAQQLGGNAVINIRSYYRKNTVSSETQYECGAGNVVAGVTFIGDVVKLEK